MTLTFITMVKMMMMAILILRLLTKMRNSALALSHFIGQAPQPFKVANHNFQSLQKVFVMWGDGGDDKNEKFDWLEHCGVHIGRIETNLAMSMNISRQVIEFTKYFAIFILETYLWILWIYVIPDLYQVRSLSCLVTKSLSLLLNLHK